MAFPAITPPPHIPLPVHGIQARAWAQPENCVSGFSNTQTACSALTSRVDTCASVLAADKLKPVEESERFASCFCRQELFSDIVVCKGIHRECILDYAYDSDFDKYQSQWLDFCKSASPDLKVTTPPVPQVTVPPATGTCDYVKTACDRYTRYTDLCSSNYASNTVNCLCQPQIQYVESICTIDGGALCARATGTASFRGFDEVGDSVELDDLWAYKSCETWLGIPGTLVYGKSEYSRVASATPRVTNAPFVDFPLTYFNVPTDPAFGEPTLNFTTTNRGSSLRGMGLVLGICISLAVGMQIS